MSLPAMRRAMGLMLARNRRPDSEVTFGWRVD